LYYLQNFSPELWFVVRIDTPLNTLQVIPEMNLSQYQQDDNITTKNNTKPKQPSKKTANTFTNWSMKSLI